MTSRRRLDQDLPSLLAQLAPHATPDYRDDIVQRTAGMAQRPAWTFPERWISMTVITSRVAAGPRIPWRFVAAAALLLVVLVFGVVLIGSSPSQLPAPFGPASNGRVAYAADGDIYTIDPVSGAATAVVTGPDIDIQPVWSRDGTLIAFQRKASSTSSSGWLYVARPDGEGLVQVTPDALDPISSYAFSPNGRQLVITSGPDGNRDLSIAKADGTGVRGIDIERSPSETSYLPDGSAVVFAEQASVSVGDGIYAVDVRSEVIRRLLAPTPGLQRGWVRVSPDGSRIAYVSSTDHPARNTYVVHVMNADGTGDVTLPMPSDATFQDAPEWSNDGTRLAIIRGYSTRNQAITIAVVPADGSGVGLESAQGLTGCCDTRYEWAPDDTSILVSPIGLLGEAYRQQLLLDPSTGSTELAPWTSTSGPAWQRVAP